MEAFTDFLVANYFWFLILSLVLVFALIGYFVDQSEQKKGVSLINKPKEEEIDISELASMAQNKSMSEAVSDAVKNSNSFASQVDSYVEQANNNIIQDHSNATSSTNTVGFDVLSK